MGRPPAWGRLGTSFLREGSSSQDISTENKQPSSLSDVSASMFLFDFCPTWWTKCPWEQEHHLGPRGWVDLQQNGNSGFGPLCLCCSSCHSCRRVSRRCCSSCRSPHTKGKRKTLYLVLSAPHLAPGQQSTKMSVQSQARARA